MKEKLQNRLRRLDAIKIIGNCESMLTAKGKMVMLIAMNGSKMADRYLGGRFADKNSFINLLTDIMAERDSLIRTPARVLEDRRKAQKKVDLEPCLTAKGIAVAKVMMVGVDLFVEWYLEGLPERNDDGLALSTKGKES